MSRVISHSNESRSFYPVSLDSDHQWASVSGTESSMFADSNSNTYYQINFTTGSGAESWWWLIFNCAGWIPNSATINSVSLTYKIYRTGTNANQIATKTYQMYADSTGKGTAQAIINSQNSAQTLNDPGTWTATELNTKRVSLYSYIKRGTSNTSTNYYGRVYGATFTINASWNEIEYQVTGSSQSNTSASISIPNEYTSEGGSITITINNVEDIIYLGVIDNGNNVANYLVHTSGNSYTYTIDNIFEDHVITLIDVVAYNISIVNNSTNISSLDPPVGNNYKTGEATDYDIDIYINNINSIYVFDNNVNKSNQITTQIPHIINSSTEHTTAFNSYEGESISNQNNGVGDKNSSNYAQLTPNGQDNTSYMLYDVGIPTDLVGRTNIILNSITCEVSGGLTTSGGNGKLIKLLINGTSVGQVAMTQFNTTIYTFNISSSDLENITSINSIQLRLEIKASNSYKVYLYGADITLNYEYDDNTYYRYTVQNVQGNHTVRFEDRPSYSITTVSNSSEATWSPTSSLVYEGNSSTFTINISNITHIILYDNNVDVTSSISNKQYTLTNVNAAHTLRLEEAPHHTITTSSSLTGASLSPLNPSIYTNESIEFTITATNINAVKLLLDNVDVTYGIVNFKYTVTDNGSNRTLSIVEQTKHTISSSSEYSGVSVSTNVNNLYPGESFTITLTGVSNIDLITIKDNNLVITNRFTGSGTTKTYTVTDVHENHTIIVIAHVTYNVIVINDNQYVSNINPSGTTSVDAGDDYTLTFNSSNSSKLFIIDNDINKTEDLVHISAQSGSPVFNPTGTADSTNFTTNDSYPLSNGYNSISNTSNYARLQLNTNNTTTDCYIYYTFSVSGIPTNATITSIACTARIYANNRVTTGTGTGAASIQLYTNTTAKGSAQTGLSTSAQNISISNTGSWTVSELNNIRLKITGRRSATNQNGYIYFYGANLTITYSIPEHYEYTIAEVSAAHTIQILEEYSTQVLYRKVSNQYVAVAKVYKKTSGVWVEQSDLLNIFETNKIYINK